MTEINMGNPGVLKTSYSYWGIDHLTTFYGKLWEIKTTKQPGGTPVLQDIQYTWDAEGNLTLRNDIAAGAKESFSYDFLDRLISPARAATVYSPGEANGDGVIDSLDMDYVMRVIMGLNTPTPGCDANQNGVIDMGDVVFISNMLAAYYTAYNALGNITSMRGNSYTYGTKPHAVTQVGTTAYTYDANGNMLRWHRQSRTCFQENPALHNSG